MATEGSIAPAAARGQGAHAETEGRALTMGDCYRLALQHSALIAIQRERLKETEARMLKSLSGLMPRASFELSEKRQDGSGSSSFTLRKIPERTFVFEQPLFSGFKEFAAMAAARSERRQRTHEQARAEQLLLLDVAEAFYLLLEQREDLGVLEAIRTALLNRIEELAQRQRLGRSRPGEVASAEVQLRQIEATMEAVRGRETVSRELLEFLTGRPIEAIHAADAGLPPLDPEASYVAKTDARPDVQAAEAAWRFAQRAVMVARADFWPEVDLESSYYVKRIGVSSGVDWDVLLTVDVPLFQGGEALAASREAATRARQALWQLAQRRREGALGIRRAYTELQAGIRRLAALERALEAAEENDRLQAADYRLSLVNNLDVLQALQTLQDVRRDVIHARYEAKRLYWHLEVSCGETVL